MSHMMARPRPQTHVVGMRRMMLMMMIRAGSYLGGGGETFQMFSNQEMTIADSEPPLFLIFI